jgi:hypothetical protein
MNANDLPPPLTHVVDQPTDADGDLLLTLLQSPAHVPSRAELPRIHGVVVGELMALTEGAFQALVRVDAQAGACTMQARSGIDLHGAHIGRPVVLMFEGGDPSLPIVVGVLQGADWPDADRPGQVEVDTDGRRMVVSAKEQLVLRCGKASITLTKAGKVLIEGSYLLSRSTGVNRVKGGSVQLN